MSILKEISPEYSLKGLMLKLKLQYFGHLIWRAGSIEKTLILGRLRAEGEGGNRGWDGWMVSLTQWTWVWANSRRRWRTGKSGMLQFMGSQRFRHDLVTEQQCIKEKYVLLYYTLLFYLKQCACVVSCFRHVQLLATPWPTSLLFPWDSPGKKTGMGCHFLPQGVFLTQGSNSCFLHLLYHRQILYYWATGEEPSQSHHHGLILIFHSNRKLGQQSGWLKSEVFISNSSTLFFQS